MKLGEMLRIIFTEPASASEGQRANKKTEPDSQKKRMTAEKLKMQQQASFSFLSKLAYFSNYFFDAIKPIKQEKLKKNESKFPTAINQKSDKKPQSGKEQFNAYCEQFQQSAMNENSEFYDVNYFAYSPDCRKVAREILNKKNTIFTIDDNQQERIDQCEAAEFLLAGYEARLREMKNNPSM